jgi:VIT1/CCC1 family predicted Fe2+/Mn2+ transporter
MNHEADGWTDEMRAAYLYRVLAGVEKNASRSALFAQLAHEAEGQAQIWAETAGAVGAARPAPYVPDVRTRLVARLLRAVGPRAMRGILAAMKVRGLSVYGHAVPGHPVPTSIDEMASRHAGIAAGGNLRAAVFGANDGLISNCCLILGVAGAGAPEATVVLTGIAGLLAGAFSMASGEYVSMRSQREMFEHQIGLERAELQTYPEEEAEELALVYAARGLPQAEARRLADRVIASPELALDTLAREELGLNPDDLGSPGQAALHSFAFFALGALVPILPFAMHAGSHGLALSAGLTGGCLFLLGMAISLFTGRNAIGNGVRMLLIGGAAGLATFFIGRLLGVSLA